MKIVNEKTLPVMANGIARAYKEIFGSEPWNEGFVCPECKRNFALDSKFRNCPVCKADGKSVALAEYWPIDKIISDMNAELRKDGAICIAATDNSNVVGFTWGYVINANPAIDDYLEAPGLARLIDGDYFYLDEVGVIPRLQHNGIGSRLVREILAAKPSLPVLLRTKNESYMFEIAKGLGGQTVLNITRDRVIMAINR